MPIFYERNLDDIYTMAQRWKKDCLMDNRSLMWPNESVWTTENLREFKKCFIDNPDPSEKSFEEKFQIQLSSASESVVKLACELLLIYFLFPVNVSGRRKRELIQKVASWRNIDINGLDLQFLDNGVGDPGGRYNFNRPFEIKQLALFSLLLLEKTKDERKTILEAHLEVRKILDKLQDEGETVQIRHIILNLLFPDFYERIASGRHKKAIVEVFKPIVTDIEVPEDPDDALHEIRRVLETLLGTTEIDFYRSPLRECWFVEGNADEIDPVSALLIKKQIVLYGPPGTGKTHEAKYLADAVIRQSVLRLWGVQKYFHQRSDVDALVSSRVHRVQFHPGYGYEDFIRGLQLENGETKYKDGVLLHILKAIEKDPPEHKDLPFVLILDEMNRADLSKVLGECFSLIEDRGSSILLGGHGDKAQDISLPNKLYIIGTMNLIDQSLEHVDFALRRRFLWFFRGYDGESLMKICREHWESLRQMSSKIRDWNRVESEFEVFEYRCRQLNRLIEEDRALLGPNYQIGHTYFRDVVDFAQQELLERPKMHNVLYNKDGTALAPVIALWKYSIKPLLEQYLNGTDTNVSERWIANARSTFLGVRS